MRLPRILPATLAAIAFLSSVYYLPSAWCRRGAPAWYRGDSQTQTTLADTVILQSQKEWQAANYHTGSAQFSGEWLFGTYLMAGIGLCQIVREHPETRSKYTPVIEHCLDQLLTKRVREYDRASWNGDPIDSLAGPDGHAAYLGYFNFLLGLYRQIAPGNWFAALNDQITDALIRRYERAPSGLLATYPNEWYPVDNTPALASIALSATVTKRDVRALLAHEETIFRARFIDSSSGLLIQAVNIEGVPTDSARGSGSALAAFFLREVYPDLGRQIFGAMKRSLESGFLGFGAIREYPHGQSGFSDIDSGPILFGFGFSATGFAIGAARIYGDEPLYARLYSSAFFAGVPSFSHGRLDFLTGGSLGNSILLAMFTAPRS